MASTGKGQLFLEQVDPICLKEVVVHTVFKKSSCTWIYFWSIQFSLLAEGSGEGVQPAFSESWKKSTNWTLFNQIQA